MEGPLSLQAKVCLTTQSTRTRARVPCFVRVGGRPPVTGNVRLMAAYLERKASLTASEMFKWRFYKITHS